MASVLTPYEEERKQRIERNKAQLAALGFDTTPTAEEKPKRGVKRPATESRAPRRRKRQKRQIDPSIPHRRSRRLSEKEDTEGHVQMLAVLASVSKDLEAEREGLLQFITQVKDRLGVMKELYAL